MKRGRTGTENNVFNETGPSQMNGKSCKYILSKNVFMLKGKKFKHRYKMSSFSLDNRAYSFFPLLKGLRSSLTLSTQCCILYRNQSFDFLCKSND